MSQLHWCQQLHWLLKVVVALEHIGLAPAVADVMPTLTFDATVTDASAAVPQSPVTLA